MQKIAGVVVWYNPINEVKKNIDSYLESIDKLYIVDNSSADNGGLVDHENSQIVYCPLYKNTGIAKALNVGIDLAIRDGMEIIITFDQDTYCDIGVVNNMYRRLMLENENTVIAPNVKHIYRKYGKRYFSDDNIYLEEETSPKWVITSGSMFHVELYNKVGAFDEKLFVGQVDQDFCYRVYKTGGKIIRMASAYIYQEAGNTRRISLGTRDIHIPNLSAMRYYYIFRNELYLRKKWGKSYKDYKVNLFVYLVCIFFFEKQKLYKVREILRGIKDAKRREKVFVN